MARPKKDTIDYFPHPCKNGSKMFIMEQAYGDKGYVAYYKLLEFLGASEGHYLDFNNDKDRLFFCAAIKADNELMNKIINTLVEVGAINKELWQERKIIWCQDLIDSVSDLYKKRNRNIPLTPILDNNNLVNDNENTQSKVNESKVNESKVNYTYPNFFNDECFNLWNILIKEKKWKNKSQHALQLSLDEISKAQNKEDAIEMIKKSIAGNWQGIFQLDKNKNHVTTSKNKPITEFKSGGPGQL